MFKDNHFLIIVPAGPVVMFCSGSLLLFVNCGVVHEVSVIKDLFFPIVFIIAMERPFLKDRKTVTIYDLTKLSVCFFFLI